MASVVRQPFAPIDGARLQSLTSTKNRQNSIFTPSSKRKAESIEIDDSENVDPLSSKRSKGASGLSKDTSEFLKKSSAFTLEVAPSKFSLELAPSAPRYDAALKENTAPAAAASRRTILKPRAPVRSSPIGGSSSSLASLTQTPPSRRASKRSGLLSSRRRSLGSSAFGRVEQTKLAAAPFSLDAALKGTFAASPAFSSRDVSSLAMPSSGASLDFCIHEDTPEQEMTNLLQHSTCVLDISSDEESAQKARREKDEGRDKENIPPPNDVSQTSRAPAGDDMLVEKMRNPLSQLDAADYYAAGCDEKSVVLVEEEAEAETAQDVQDVQEGIDGVLAGPVPDVEEGLSVVESADIPHAHVDEDAATEHDFGDIQDTTAQDFTFRAPSPTVDQLMSRNEPRNAAVLAPVEGTGESFDLWESGSANDMSSPPSPVGEAEPVLAAKEGVEVNDENTHVENNENSVPVRQ